MHFNREKNQLEKRCFYVLQMDKSEFPQLSFYRKCEVKNTERKIQGNINRPSVHPSSKEIAFINFLSYGCYGYTIRITITKQISSALRRKLMRSFNGSKRFTFVSEFICMHLCMIYIETWSACIIQKPAYFTDLIRFSNVFLDIFFFFLFFQRHAILFYSILLWHFLCRFHFTVQFFLTRRMQTWFKLNVSEYFQSLSPQLIIWVLHLCSLTFSTTLNIF